MSRSWGPSMAAPEAMDAAPQQQQQQQQQQMQMQMGGDAQQQQQQQQQQQAKRSSLATLAEKIGGAGAGAGAGGKGKASKIESVKVDGLVLLKIIKHCTESLPELCSGSLLGLDVGSDLEVTNSFPFPKVQRAVRPDRNDRFANKYNREKEEAAAKKADEQADAEGLKYNHDMLKLLRDINVDCNPVGWYRSTYMGSFCTSDLVQQLFQYQDQLDDGAVQKSVVLVYDPFQTKKGNLAIRAYRLTDVFMKMLRERKAAARGAGVVKLSAAVVAAVGGLKGDGSAVIAVEGGEMELSAEDVFEEVPVEVSNAHLFTVLIEDIKERNGERLEVDFDRLNLSTNPYLEKNFEFLVEEVDNLIGEQSKRQQDQRKLQHIEANQIKWIMTRRMENRAREERGEPLLPEDADPKEACFKPQGTASKLESLLIRKQISIYCNQINKFTGAGFSKLYLSSAIQGTD